MHHGVEMRTTLNLDEDALEIARDRASLKGLSLSAAVNELIRDASQPRDVKIEFGPSGFPLIRCSPGSPQISQEDIFRIIQEEDGLQDANLRS